VIILREAPASALHGSTVQSISYRFDQIKAHPLEQEDEARLKQWPLLAKGCRIFNLRNKC